MDQELLVENQIEDGEKLLIQFVQAGFDVTVAFWVLTSEDKSWLFYIGSAAVNPGSVGDAYSTLYACLTKIPDASVSLSDVRLVNPSDPIARDTIAVRDRQLARMHGARLPIHYHGKRLGDLAIEEAYIYYPKIGQMTRDEVLQTVMALLKTSGPAQPATFTFADGSVKRAIPSGLQLQMHGPGGGLQIVLLDPGTGQSQAVAARQVMDIQRFSRRQEEEH